MVALLIVYKTKVPRMNLIQYVKDLIGTFKKEDVKNKVRILIARITDYVLPSVEQLRAVGVFKSELYTTYILNNRAFLAFRTKSNNRAIGPKSSWIDMLEVGCKNAVTILERLPVDQRLPSTITVEGITYSTASVLKLVNSIDLFVEYTSRLMYHMVQYESGVAYRMTPLDVKFLSNNQSAWITTLGLLLRDPEALLVDLSNEPELVVGSPREVFANSDVERLNFIPGVTPLFKRIGITMVNWELERTERLKLEKRGIETAIERYRQQSLGQFDARSEMLMENWRNELVLVNQKISRMEGSV